MLFAAILGNVAAFAPSTRTPPCTRTASLSSTATDNALLPALRTAAMKLHTREQAPKEGQAPSTPREPFVPTQADYLHFLVDSKHVYEAMEAFVETHDLETLQNTGLERVKALEKDIEYMAKTFQLDVPKVGAPGISYANHIQGITSIPEFLCHYYNFYFAHTAGGRMIGKQMSKLLLDGVTLEFYKWDGDLNELKETTKNAIEDLAATWATPEERQQCIDATPAAFQEGGAINMYLMEKH